MADSKNGLPTQTATAYRVPMAGGAGTISKDYLPVMVGDGGSGGSKGAVPAPSAGDASKYLRGDATWQTVVGGGGGGQFDYGLVTESPTTNLDWGSVV